MLLYGVYLSLVMVWTKKKELHLGHFCLCNLFWINIPKKNKKNGRMIGNQFPERSIYDIVKTRVGKNEKRMNKNILLSLLILAKPLIISWCDAFFIQPPFRHNEGKHDCYCERI